MHMPGAMEAVFKLDKEALKDIKRSITYRPHISDGRYYPAKVCVPVRVIMPPVGSPRCAEYCAIREARNRSDVRYSSGFINMM